MKKLTARQIRRLLSTRVTPEPPAGLADRIKAEIPGLIQVGAIQTAPSRSPALRPLWLIAASLLVVVGAGFMVIRLVVPSESFSRRIALDGVPVIRDVVVTVPARSAVERQKLALATTTGKSDAMAPRSAAAPDRRAAGAGPQTLAKERPTATRVAGEGTNLPRGEVATGTAGTYAPSRAAEEVAVAGNIHAPAEAHAVGVADKMQLAAAPVQARKGSVVVEVRDAAGQPVAGASVRLDRAARPSVNCGSRQSGAGGASTFCTVDPGEYQVCAQAPGFIAATADVAVAPGAQVSIVLTVTRPPADGREHPWTCPTPKPPADR